MGGQIGIDDTDLKEVLAAAYERYKQRQRDKVLAQRKRAEKIDAAQVVAATTSSGGSGFSSATNLVPEKELLAEYENKIGAMPARSADGRVPIMVSSIESGQVTEIKVDAVNYWGPVRYEIVNGEPYWTGTVRYKTTSLFGTFDTEAMALIKNGAVKEWVYTGSGEEVP